MLMDLYLKSLSTVIMILELKWSFRSVEITYEKLQYPFSIMDKTYQLYTPFFIKKNT